VAEHDGLQHLLLRQLFGLRLHHHHCVSGARYHEVEGAFGHLVDHGIEHELASDDADARGADGSDERQPRQRQCCRGGDHGKYVGVVLHVMGEDGDDDLRLILEPAHEQGPDRPVDEARGQRLLFGGAALTLEIAAGDLAGGEGLFLVIDGEREKVDAGSHCLLGDHRCEHARLAILGQHRCVRLARQAAGLEGQLATRPLDFHTLCLEHLFRLVSSCFRRFHSLTRRQLPRRQPAHMSMSVRQRELAAAPDKGVR
jgi:hypothetical protein